jgi:AraC-like DNA-binding protein
MDVPPDSPAVTDLARVEFESGTFDALRAAHFTRRFPPHFHQTFAVGVVEAGTVQIRTHRGEWLARPGSILAFAPGEVHGADPVTAEGYSYRMIYPSVDYIAGIRACPASADGLGGPRLFHAPVLDAPALGRRLLGMHAALMAGGGERAVELRLVVWLHDLFASQLSPCDSVDVATHAHLAVATRARRYLEEHYAESVRLADIADECGLSPFHLIRVFRRVIGVSPYAYLVQYRVNRAQSMLTQGRTVSAIAHACGFSDQSHLTRTFKKAVGVPPGQYVRQVGPTAA